MKNFIQFILILQAVLTSTAGVEEVIYAQVGKTVTLKAPTANGPFKYAYWFKDDFQLAWLNYLGGKGTAEDGTVKWSTKLTVSAHSLTINNIQQEDFGTYKFNFNKDPEYFIFKLVKLYVSDPSSPLLPGEPLSLDCRVDTPVARRKPEIYWLNPRKENTKKSKISKSASSQDNGPWICVVTENGKGQQVEVSVKVVDLTPAPLRPQYTSKSSPLKVPCSIAPHISWDQIKAKGLQEVHWHFFPKSTSGQISAVPQSVCFLSLKQLSWKKDKHRDLKPAQSEPKNGDFSLTRKQGSEEDSGDYVCMMKFENGLSLNRTIRVEVLQIISSAGTELISGQPLNLTCSLGHPLPSDLQLRWSPPDGSSLPSLKSDHHPAHLTIPEVGTRDGGSWQCGLMQGKTQLTSAVIKLKIEPKLSVWMLVIICSAAVIVILLLVLVFILYRRRQRRMRHLTHRLCQCKNPKPKGFYRT